MKRALSHDVALSESYGLLVQTCVSCHSAYLKRE
jgi:hypothetical protein